MLIQQLKQLESGGIIICTIHPLSSPPRECAPTVIGLKLGPSMAELINWAFMR